MKKLKKKKFFKIVTVLLVIYIIIAVLFISFQYYSTIKSQVIINTSTINLSDKSKEDINIGSAKYMEKYYNYSKQINSEVIGWIYIKGTDINYPLLHGKTDSYYLDHNWQGEKFWNGCIALDQDNTSLANNTLLINGHNMLNGIMFSQLTNYESIDFAKKHNIVEIYNGTSNKIIYFKVFSAIYTKPSIELNLGNNSEKIRQETIDNLMSEKIYKIDNYNGNNILFLNTCLSNGTDNHIIVICEEI